MSIIRFDTRLTWSATPRACLRGRGEAQVVPEVVAHTTGDDDKPHHSQPKGISTSRQGGYPLRGKGDIHFRTKGISLFTARGYPLSCKGDIHFQTKGISLLAAWRGDLRAWVASLNRKQEDRPLTETAAILAASHANFADSGGIWQDSRSTTRRHNRQQSHCLRIISRILAPLNEKLGKSRKS